MRGGGGAVSTMGLWGCVGAQHYGVGQEPLGGGGAGTDTPWWGGMAPHGLFIPPPPSVAMGDTANPGLSVRRWLRRLLGVSLGRTGGGKGGEVAVSPLGAEGGG